MTHAFAVKHPRKITQYEFIFIPSREASMQISESGQVAIAITPIFSFLTVRDTPPRCSEYHGLEDDIQIAA